MATWRICDEHWYWFTTFKTDTPITTEQAEINRALNVEPGLDDMNLWRCRHCGAMVPGTARTAHLKFHIATNTQYLYGDLEKDTYENTLRKAPSDRND